MCGIIGFTGQAPALSFLLDGLRRMEYRGYDSAGVALCGASGDRLDIRRAVGNVSELEKAVAENPPDRSARCGIGHTRWATHGAPSERNAHPHVSPSGKIAIVHNGIIDNFAELKARLAATGHVFNSDTDSEVLAHLVEEAAGNTLAEKVMAALTPVRGTYGIAVVSCDWPGVIVVARKGSPIAVGIAGSAAMVASDPAALAGRAERVAYLDDGDVAILTPGSFEVRSLANTPVDRPASPLDIDPAAVEKGGFEHFMLKEIFEQPEALENCLRGRLLPDEGTAKLSGLRLGPREMASLCNIVVTACGTSYYAGLHGVYAFEQFAGIPSRIEQAAEFRYRNPIVSPDTALVSLSQSGETADTLAAVREAKRKGALVLSICNVVGSTIAREAGRGVYLHAGPEIGVASTKAFLCQVAALEMMALLLGRTRRLSGAEGAIVVKALESTPELVRAVLAQNDRIATIAEKYASANDAFFIGRGYQYPAALEGALKLKEISYVHAEGYHAAELKHGPIALLEPAVPVVALAPQGPEHDKTLANIQECRARSAPVVAIATESDPAIRAFTEDIIEVPPCPDFIAAVPVVVAEQLFAYHVARLRGEPIDRPRNLAKSVTVE
ncbi:MAG: glutamine--fructose-6-phosphate transaminase (isomerizing) [Kiritimatiellae bacterium]|nr:glutamine--fructose-6-phosphate transaminase (isomerizing) [Kiritimatiellia bacterium]